MSKYLEIKVTKAVLYLTEAELMNGLPKETLKEALRRGKAFSRAEQAKNRKLKEPKKSESL